jgi:TrmH family RNA methyltransferase
MGAVFGQPVARAGFEEGRISLGDGRRSIALVPRHGVPLADLNLSGRLLFCLGSERLGLPGRIAEACDEVCHVPLHPGGAESLNVAMMATICLYESALARLGRGR